MVLSFKEQFVDPILADIKIHSLRQDPKKRWFANRKINFATGVRTKKYNEFKTDTCHGTEPISIKWGFHELGGKYVTIYINNKNLVYYDEVFDLLVKNDGFSSRKEFLEWFSEDFDGHIIHWTDFRYSTLMID